jgi:CrcB protein
MKLILLIGTGSFIGGITRYLLQTALQGKVTFPYGTFCVNIVGCFLIGLAFALTTKFSVSNETKLFLTTGILGGFTTFSAFSNETFLLVKSHQYSAAAIYAILSVVIGVLATAGGYFLIKN